MAQTTAQHNHDLVIRVSVEWGTEGFETTGGSSRTGTSNGLACAFTYPTITVV